MTTQLILIMCFGGLLGAVVWMASKNGSKAAQLESLKAELKKRAEEQSRAQHIMDNVHRTDIDRVREQLQTTK